MLPFNAILPWLGLEGNIAALGGLEALVGGLGEKEKKALVGLIRAAFPNLRFGPMDTAKAENFLAYKVMSTTATSTGEFSIEHGMGRTPYMAIPMIDLSAIGSGSVPLEVTRAADNRRVYFKTASGFTGKVFSLYLE